MALPRDHRRRGPAAGPGEPVRTVTRPGAAAIVAAVVLVASYLVARERPVPVWEIDVTRTMNDAPGWVADALWPVMQLGTVWAPLLAALAVGLLRRDWLLAACVAGGGVVAWVVAKVAKELVERGRPPVYVPDVVVRDGWATGWGFPSGHSAVAAVTATVLVAAVPRRARPLLGLLAVLVGVARIVHGVHFPADVLGGWALGVLVGLGALAAYDHGRARDQGPTSSQPVTS